MLILGLILHMLILGLILFVNIFLSNLLYLNFHIRKKDGSKKESQAMENKTGAAS